MKWKNIKSLFVVDDGSDTDKQKIDAPKSQKQNEKEEEGNSIIKAGTKNVEKKETSISAPSNAKAEKGQVKEQFVNHLLKAIEANDMEGIDYLEFKNTLQSFKKMPMDESLRFQSALTAVKTMGASEKKILDSADFYLGILAKEEAGFKAAVERGRKQKVDGQLSHVEQLKASRKEKVALIEKMKQEIEQMTKEINSASEKVMEDQIKIDNKRNHFYASYEFVVNQIKNDIAQLKTHTKSTTNNNK